ncbi:MAG: hypothetical protein HQM10_14285 [Candidatus Riflebacteria bacterium]|nr:hypothetical protein [Candidatus Riflebacteria bacterium]
MKNLKCSLLTLFLCAFTSIYLSGCFQTKDETKKSSDASEVSLDSALFLSLINPDTGKPAILEACSKVSADDPLFWLKNSQAVKSSIKSDSRWNGWSWDGEWYSNTLSDNKTKIFAQFFDSGNTKMSPFSSINPHFIKFFIESEAAYNSQEYNFALKMIMGNSTNPFLAEKTSSPVEGYIMRGYSQFTTSQNSIISGIPISNAISFSLNFGGSDSYFFSPLDSTSAPIGVLRLETNYNGGQLGNSYQFNQNKSVTVSTFGLSSLGSQDAYGTVSLKEFNTPASSSSAIAKSLFLPMNGKSPLFLKAACKMNPVVLFVERLKQTSSWSTWTSGNDGWYNTHSEEPTDFYSGSTILQAKFYSDDAGNVSVTPTNFSESKKGTIQLAGTFAGNLFQDSGNYNVKMFLGTNASPFSVKVDGSDYHFNGILTAQVISNNAGFDFSKYYFTFEFTNPNSDEGFTLPESSFSKVQGRITISFFVNNRKSFLINFDLNGTDASITYKPYSLADAPANFDFFKTVLNWSLFLQK